MLTLAIEMHRGIWYHHYKVNALGIGRINYDVSISYNSSGQCVFIIYLCIDIVISNLKNQPPEHAASHYKLIKTYVKKHRG